MTKVLKLKRLRGSSIFKIIVLESAIGFAAISTFIGLFSLFGKEVIQWNGEYITGVMGFLISPFVGLFAGGFMGLFISIFVYLGSRIHSFLGGMIVEYVPYDESE